MPARNLKRIDLYCPEYQTNAIIRIVENHPNGSPHLTVDYQKGGTQPNDHIAAEIPSDWGDKELVEMIFLRDWPRMNDRNWPNWEIHARDYASPHLLRFWESERAA